MCVYLYLYLYSCIYIYVYMQYMFIVCLSPLEGELHKNRKLVLFNVVPLVPRTAWHIVGVQ